jgi:UDP-N-acetylmuramate: L-alanyl-gamma-D-glutamyl-meso-diaminopimelate ligase
MLFSSLWCFLNLPTAYCLPTKRKCLLYEQTLTLPGPSPRINQKSEIFQTRSIFFYFNRNFTRMPDAATLPTPETILQQALDKQRVVITGTRGTTTLTALLIHVLKFYNRSFDYVISAPVHGLSETSSLSPEAPVIIIESGVEEMIHYKHHIGLIANVMWSASEPYSTEEEYVKQYDSFADSTPKGGILLYCENDPLALVIGAKPRTDVLGIGYKIHPHTSDSGHHFLTSGKERIPVKIFGSQNFQNISGAQELLKRLGITQQMFYHAISSFE